MTGKEEVKSLFLDSIKDPMKKGILGSFSSNVSIKEIAEFENQNGHTSKKKLIKINFFVGNDKVFFLEENLLEVVKGEFLLDQKKLMIKFFYKEIDSYLILFFLNEESVVGNFGFNDI